MNSDIETLSNERKEVFYRAFKIWANEKLTFKNDPLFWNEYKNRVLRQIFDFNSGDGYKTLLRLLAEFNKEFPDPWLATIKYREELERENKL